MNETRNKSLILRVTALFAVVLWLLSGTQAAWAQTQRGVVANANVTKVNTTDITTTGQVVGVGEGSTVTVTVASQPNKVARVTVSSTTINVSSITVTSAGNATSINVGSTLQMSATVTPTYANNNAVTWSVTNAGGSAATISSTGLLTAGTSPGTVTVTATAADGSGATGTKTITITTIPLTDAMVQDIAAQFYTGSHLTPPVTVKDGSKTLILDTDYTVNYGDNVNVADGGTVTVTGKGVYSGSVTKHFTIVKQPLIITAKAQTVNYGTAIAQGANQVTIVPLCSGHSLSAITLTQSTTNATTNGTITPSAATIRDGSNNNVTSNYDIAYNTGTLTINKVNPAYTAPTAKTNLVYNGSEQTLINAGSATGGTMYYSLDNSNWYTSVDNANMKRTNANTSGYTVYYKVIGDGNHNDVAASISVPIAKAAGQVKLSEYRSSGWQTINNEKSYTIKVDHHGGILSYTKTGNMNVSISDDNIHVTISKGTGFAAGNVEITSGETSNYNAASATYFCE